MFAGNMQRRKFLLIFAGQNLLTHMSEFNKMQTVKRRMYAMRNGVIADSLRKAGSPFRMIFGLNLPQLDEIAAETGKDKELALLLFADTNNRESTLLAPMIMPAEDMSIDSALEWFAASRCAETTDILCHKLLRKLPYAADIARKALLSGDDMMRYGGIRLLWNLLPSPATEMRPLIEAEAARCCPSTHRAATALLEEIEFFSGD